MATTQRAATCPGGNRDNTDVTQRPIIHTLPPSAGRLIIVGDVHGCRTELDLLLTKCGYQQGHDALVFVGDLVNKGPHSKEVVQRVAALGAYAVLGNHDWILLKNLDTRHRAEGGDDEAAAALADLNDPLQQLAKDFPPELEAYLRGLPHMIQIPQFNVMVTHAGLNPKVKPEQQNVYDLMHTRRLVEIGVDSETGAKKWRCSEKGDGVPWAKEWMGPQTVVFGHDAKSGWQREEFAIGIDTGCCYDGRLTALVYNWGDSPSPCIVQVDRVDGPFVALVDDLPTAETGEHLKGRFAPLGAVRAQVFCRGPRTYGYVEFDTLAQLRRARGAHGHVTPVAAQQKARNDDLASVFPADASAPFIARFATEKQSPTLEDLKHLCDSFAERFFVAEMKLGCRGRIAFAYVEFQALDSLHEAVLEVRRIREFATFRAEAVVTPAQRARMSADLGPQLGLVTMFNVEKGYGYIRPHANPEASYRFEHGATQDQPLEVGCVVSFLTTPHLERTYFKQAMAMDVRLARGGRQPLAPIAHDPQRCHGTVLFCTKIGGGIRAEGDTHQYMYQFVSATQFNKGDHVVFTKKPHTNPALRNGPLPLMAEDVQHVGTSLGHQSRRPLINRRCQ